MKRLIIIFLAIAVGAVYVSAAYVSAAQQSPKTAQADKAIAAVDYPREVERGSDDRWRFETVFTETGRKIGYSVNGEGYILDPRGGKWVTRGSNKISRGEVKVPAGGKGRDSYWCRSPDHNLCNGHAIFTWSGKDDAGNAVELKVRVYLKHTGCPGPSK